MARRMSKNVVESGTGLLADEDWQPGLEGYPVELVCRIRRDLARRLPNLREKFNRNSRYLGYGLVGGADRAYIYLQKKGLVIDLCLDPKLAKEIEALGFQVKSRENFQGRTGKWITGWRIPPDFEAETSVTNWLWRALTASPGGTRERGNDGPQGALRPRRA